ncbi:Nucleoside diphosphate-linked moiety X motif 22 [Cricetulus griseus]|uniref:DnaJ homolog subfamily C member 4 n=1 Tax=Cricetulus griseus TaxID=10029 RepID=G3I879_CRIGR|nr:Nucleoside diphosphate-linked moiety X motif 22 [Cricetulus griseus]
MDPEVSLLLLCPPGGLSQEQVAVELSPAHDRRPLPGGDKTITAIWETRLQTQPWIFDAPKFRLHSAILASSSPQPQLLLNLGLTSYRDFLGTNWSSSASWLRQQGATDWGEKQAYLADPLGVGAILVTADDFLVFLRRSQQVAEAPGMVDVPGGHPEPQALCSGGIPQHKDLPGELVVRELFSSVLQEICDEVNVPPHTLSQPLLLGIACNETSAGRASAEFHVQSSPSNYYELLGVHPDASAEEVKRAFFTKSKELHPDRDPGNPALHSRFVELNEAYRVLSREESRRKYDHQLHSASPPESSGTRAQPKYTQETHSSWEPPNAKYWAQFHRVRPQGPESRQQQHKHNQRVLGYCLLLMVAGMSLHYVAFRKLEQVHRSFMDEKDRIITAIYNDTRARARANRARIQQERQQRPQPQKGPSPSPEGPGIVPQDSSP